MLTFNTSFSPITKATTNFARQRSSTFSYLRGIKYWLGWGGGWRWVFRVQITRSFDSWSHVLRNAHTARIRSVVIQLGRRAKSSVAYRADRSNLWWSSLTALKVWFHVINWLRHHRTHDAMVVAINAFTFLLLFSDTWESGRLNPKFFISLFPALTVSEFDSYKKI